MIDDARTDQRYETLRPYLFTVAYRMTGSASDAEDPVQDAWVRFIDAGMPQVASLRAYLTTVASRLALDYLKSARVTREQYVGTWLPEPVLTSQAVDGPAEVAEQREQVSLAMLTLLEHLSPEQRIVYVLREGFDSSYEEIAEHLGKTPAACRQIFRRARQRIDASGARHTTSSPDQAILIAHFMDAFARGDATAVASLLAEDVEWAADGGPHRLANRHVIRGRDRVARGFAGLGQKVSPGLDLKVQMLDLNGMSTVTVFHHGRLERVLSFETACGAITRIRVIINPEKLVHLATSLGTDPAWETPFPLPRRARGTI